MSDSLDSFDFPDADLMIDVRDVRIVLTAKVVELYFRDESGNYDLGAARTFRYPLRADKPA